MKLFTFEVTEQPTSDVDLGTARSEPAADTLRYELLGPLRVVGPAAVSVISARKIKLLLALLLIRADQVVPTDQLIAEIWGQETPRRASAALHVYISQLRKALQRPGRPDSPIVTRAQGYVLRRGDDALDVDVLQGLVRQGRAFARGGQHAQSSQAFHAALSLWRGPVLGDLRDSPAVKDYIAWLDEVWLECVEMLIESDLALGRHRDHLARLYALVAEHPLREAFHRQLMLALYRSGRQTDALRVYQSARAILHSELGLEPCRAVQELHRAILLADEAELRPAV